jgi:hypothetical protein
LGRAHIRPVSNRMRTTMTTKPKAPLGPYPQPLLWGHDGKTPISIKTKTISRMVPKLMAGSLST